MSGAGWGAAASALSSAYGQYMANDRQEDSQSFNAEQAATQRAWEAEMSNTKYQRTVRDLIAADLNPMLAISQGAGHTGGGAAATSSPSGASTHDIAGGMQAGSAAELNQAAIARTNAEAGKLNAEEAEIRERTPTHDVTRRSMEQNINESQERIQKIMQEVKTGGATEDNLRQQTTNLQALIPQIKATIEQIKAQTGLTGAQRVLAGAHTAQSNAATSEISQRTASDLPALEAALMRLEKVAKDMEMPRRQQDESVHDSFLGSLSATMRALNPFTNIMPTIGIQGTGAPKPQPGRKDWKK